MVMTRNVMEQLAGKGILGELVEYLEETFEGFTDIQRRYRYALETIRKELGEGTSPSVDDLIDAIERQTASNLFFSGVLGLKANLDHFINPMGRTMLDVDFEVYLRENTAHRLPEYEKAKSVIDCFFAALSPVQKEVFEDITEYISYLETVGPKLAHLYGFIIGDELLYKIVPGYYPDCVLTLQYRAMVDEYLRNLGNLSLPNWGKRTKFLCIKYQ